MYDERDEYRFVPANPGWYGFTYGYEETGWFKDLNEVFEFVKGKYE